MDRDTAEKVLDGSLHNYSVLDAMRRAANGRSGNIHGTSGLDPIDGITFTTGSEASRNGRPDISILEIDVDDVPNTDRQHIVLMARSEGVAD